MPIQYEALIGHLSVVGNKPSDDPPPGAKIQVSPRRVHRSREQDTIFVLIAPAGQAGAKPDFYEDLAALACNVYFKSRLGVTGALREVAEALNDDVLKRNQLNATDYRAAAMVLVKRLEEVYLMRVGATISVAQLANHYETFPLDPDMLNIMPLGARSEPQVQFQRYELSPDDLFVLGDAGIAAISDAVLRAAVATHSLELVLETLEKSVQRQAFATVIKFIDGDATPPEPAYEASLPTSMTIEEEESSVEPSAVPVFAKPEISINEPIAAAAASEAIASNTSDASSSQDKDDEDTYKPSEAQRPTPDIEIPTEPEPVAEATPAKRPRQNILQVIFAGILMLVAGILRTISYTINAVLDRLLPEPSPKTQNQQSVIVPIYFVALVAIIVPVIVAVMVVGVAISNRDATAFEGLRDTTVQAYNDALALEENQQAPNSDKRLAWVEVRRWAQQALNENAESDEMIDILVEAQNRINFYDRVTPTDVRLLREFEANANLRGPILGGQDIYTLDRNRSQVYRDVLDGAGQNVVERGEIPILERGRRVNNFIVANILDIEWITTPGAAQIPALIALDENGLLLSYQATFGEGAIQLQLPPEWNRPVAMALWDVNLYVLDAGANQIWRYRPENGLFSQPPEEYFTGNSRPELRDAVDFGIEQGGDIFILFNDGTVSRYRGGEPLVFELDNETAPVEGINNGTALYVNNDGGDYALYIADQNNDTIYKVSLGGSVRAGYRPLNLLSDIFDNVTGIYDNPSQGTIYILAGNQLYYAPRIVE